MQIADSRMRITFGFSTAFIVSPSLIVRGRFTYSMRLIHSNFSALTALSTNSNKQLSPLWNKKTGLGARWGRITRDPVTVVGIVLLENFHVALAGEHIRSVPDRIVGALVCLP